jgi:lipoyltransferase 1
MFPLVPLHLHLHLSRQLVRHFSLLSDIVSHGHVFFCPSNDIFINLSLEDYLYRQVDFADKNVLLMWINEPAVVIGRHQNPWVECNLRECERERVSVVRRNSGGGTVYHDVGNLNCSFLTSKKNYNRSRNLRLISDVLKRHWSVESEITKREDLVLSGSGEKISGTASKLGAKNAYHHLTLLVNVNMNDMRRFIRKSAVSTYI